MKLYSRIASGIVFTLLLTNTLILASNISLKVESYNTPTIMWSKTYGGADYDKVNSVVQTIDGGYALVGETNSFGAGEDDVWLVKTDALGNMQWNKTYGGTSRDFGVSIVQTTDGGFIMACSTMSFGAGSWDIWLVKTDDLGNVQWNKTFGGIGVDCVEGERSIIQTSDGGYIIAGFTLSFGENTLWLIKTDALGNIKWNKTYGPYWGADSIVQTSDGGYAIAGYVYVDGSADFLLLKVDSDGNMEWYKTYGGAGYDYAKSVVQTIDGGYALVGETESFGAGEYDVWLVKTDALGNMQWNKTYGGINLDEGVSLIQTNDGGYAIACWVGDFWLIKTDPDGEVQWSMSEPKGSAWSVIQTAGGEYVVAGSMNNDFWLIKFGIQYEHELTVELEAPKFVKLRETTILNATIYNHGICDEANVELKILINNTVVDSVLIPQIPSESSYTFSYSWTPDTEGTYNITAYTPPVPGEKITTNNVVTTEVIIMRPLISPEEGQYANYLFTSYSNSVNPLEWAKYNVTYAQYVSPSIINITIWQQSSDSYTYNSWLLVNVLTREIVGGGPYSPPLGYYFGWIETNVTTGSSIRIFDTYGYVEGEEVIAAAGTYIDCWVIETIIDSYNYTWWFDKATGLWIGIKMINLTNSDTYILGFLVDTNIPVGGALIIETDKPMYARLETVTVTANYVIGNTPIENATITFQVNYPNGTLYFVWTEETNANGTAVFRFFIDETAPYGVYTISATAYKIGYDPKSATTTFLVAYLEPRIVLRFEGPEVALIGFNTTIILHIENSGNATAYNVTAHLTIPDSLTVIIANTTFTGTIDPGKEITLIATVTTSLPSRYLLTASTEYFKADGTPMPIVYTERYIAFGYHQDYPVDIVALRVSYTSTQIILNLTVTNYGESSVQVVLIASAQHIATKLMLKSAYRTVTLDPNETLSVQLVLNIPTSASTGDYLVKGILATDLPSNSGFTLTQVSRIITL